MDPRDPARKRKSTGSRRTLINYSESPVMSPTRRHVTVLNINHRQFSENVFYIHQCLFFTDKMTFKILKSVDLFELIVLSLLII